MKDFLLHLLTITIGLLIAVGIEGCVAIHRQHVLLGEARQTLREEIEYNSKTMSEGLPDIEQEKTAIANNIAVLKRIADNPEDKDAQNQHIDAHVSTVSLRDTAWKTAQATGALAFMPYAEAQRYADLYSTQHDFLTQQEKMLEDEAQFLGVVAKADLKQGETSREHANLALERFGVWQGHLLYLGGLAQLTALSDKAFLEGKPAPDGMSVELHGGSSQPAK